MVFESKKEGKRLQATAKKFASRMAAVELKGWDWMHQMRMGVLGGRDDIVLLGMGKHFELWDKATYDAQEAQAVQGEMPDVLKDFSI